jgi:hypothetical protein
MKIENQFAVAAAIIAGLATLESSVWGNIK